MRPYKLLQAFTDLGYDVEEVVGYGAERRSKTRELSRELSRGREFAFAYSESHTLPTLLTEPHHLPFYPTLDFGLFTNLKSAGVPIGLFYRDIFWRFENFKRSYSFWKRSVMLPAYQYDWRRYQRLVDHLFLPSLAMQHELPSKWPRNRLSELPPGADIHEDNQNRLRSGTSLRLLYVGGVTPPLYDLSPLFHFARNSPDLEVLVCCRKSEWEANASHYTGHTEAVKIVHASGSELDNLYRSADAALIIWEPFPYLNFAMPVKLFEALGFGVPIICSPDTEVSRFVEAEDVGWVVDSNESFRMLTKSLLENPKQLREKQARVAEVRMRHSWRERAKEVSRILHPQ